jgi:hypothetical protein
MQSFVSRSLVQAVLQLRDDPALCAKYGANGRRAVIAHCSRQAAVEQLLKLLDTRTNG